VTTPQADGLWALCMRAYYAADESQRADRRTRWVMDLDHYKQIRAVSEAYRPDDEKTDPETWVPDPGDVLCRIPIDVRDDGGEPHLETPVPASAYEMALLTIGGSLARLQPGGEVIARAKVVSGGEDGG
jgi:hypothetical protein